MRVMYSLAGRSTGSWFLLSQVYDRFLDRFLAKGKARCDMGVLGGTDSYVPADIWGQLDLLQIALPLSSFSWTTRTKFHRMR